MTSQLIIRRVTLREFNRRDNKIVMEIETKLIVTTAAVEIALGQCIKTDLIITDQILGIDAAIIKDDDCRCTQLPYGPLFSFPQQRSPINFRRDNRLPSSNFSVANKASLDDSTTVSSGCMTFRRSESNAALSQNPRHI